MPVKLHRCKHTWVHTELDACWRVEKALRELGIEHEVVKHSKLDRADVKRLTGQRWLPVIEFEDGSAYRADSRAMAARIRSGRLGAGGAVI